MSSEKSDDTTLGITLPTPTGTLDADGLHAQLSQANVCRMRQQWAEAIDHCIAVLRAEPGNQAAHALLGDIYHDQKKLEDAHRWYQMAVDIHPNPSDVAKLKQVEDELVRKSGLARPEKSPKVAMGEDGSVVSGTINLMGYSPRNWLRTITAVSFIFVVVMIGWLLQTQFRARRYADVPRPMTNSGAPVAGTPSDPLPPAPLGGGGQNMGNPNANPDPNANAGGTGFAPDKKPDGAAPSTPGTPQNPSGKAPQEGTSSATPTAPVIAVRPMENMPNLPTPQGGDATALPGDMHIADIANAQSSSPKVQVRANIASASQITPELRERILRNAVRAAQSVFQAHSGAQRVSVNVTSESDAPLFSAEVERASLEGVNLDTSSLEQIEESLKGMRWAEGQPSGGGQ